MSPLVSVVIAAYKRHYLLQTLDSVFKQTYPNVEIVVVDDGSPNRLRELLEDHIANDRIRYVYRENGKMGAAKNTGIENTKGDLIAFLDDDDLWVENKLEKQVRLFENPKVHLVYSWSVSFRRDQVFERPAFQNIEARGNIFSTLFVGNFIPGGSVVVRKKCLEDVGLFNETPDYYGVDDYDLWLRITHKYDVDLVPEPLLRHRLHENQFSSNIEFMLNQELTIRGDLIKRFNVSKKLCRKAYGHIYGDYAYYLFDWFRTNMLKGILAREAPSVGVSPVEGTRKA